MAERELKYLVYRCFSCGRLITKLELEATWTRAEQSDTEQKGVCPCGGGQLRPSNAKLWEELLLPRVWRLWVQEVVWPWIRAKFNG